MRLNRKRLNLKRHNLKGVPKMPVIAKACTRLCREQDGQTMAEYAVILTVIVLAVLTAIGLLSGNIGNVINSVADAI